MQLFATSCTQPLNVPLSALSGVERERLRPYMEQIDLRRGDVLYEPDEWIRHIYFPAGGVISIMTTTSDGESVEVAMVSSEGVVGVPVVLGYRKSPHRVVVQIPTSAVRVSVEALRREPGQPGGLRDLILRYTHILLLQISQAATCNRFHTAEQRLCRRLLMTRDRVRRDEFNVTQELLSYMLGIPRTSVTMIAVNLQRMGLINYTRGRIRITNARDLETASCECYRNLAQEIGELDTA